MYQSGLILLLVCIMSMTATATKPMKSFFRADTAYIKGNIKNYEGKRTGMIYFANALLSEDTYPAVVDISPEGDFFVSLPLHYPIMNSIFLADKRIPFYVTPGDTLSLTVKWINEKSQALTVDYQGRFAKINKELFQVRNVKMSPVPEPSDVEGDSVRMAYAKGLSDTYITYRTDLKKFARQQSVSSETQKLLNNQALLEQVVKLLDFDRQQTYGADNKNRINDPAKDPYYQLLKEIPWNDRTLLTCPSFFPFIKSFDFNTLLYKKWLLLDNTGIFFQAMQKSGYQLTGEEKELEEYFTTRKDDGTSVDSLKLEKLQSLKEKYYQAPKVAKAENLLVKDILFHQDMNISPGIILEISDLRKLIFMYTRDRQAALEERDLILKHLKDPFLIETAIKMIDHAFPSSNEPQNSYSLPAGKATEIFQRLIEPYKGQVILIDVWATWCQPCLYGIKDIEPIREKFAGRNVAFLFVSSEKNSPLPNFNRVMKDVKGHKVRLNEEDYLYFCQTFQIETIPRYILVDRSGNIVNPKLIPRNLEDLESVLDKLLD